MMRFEELAVEPVRVWGLPFMPLTLAQTAEAVSALIERGPSRLLHHGQYALRNADEGKSGSGRGECPCGLHRRRRGTPGLGGTAEACPSAGAGRGIGPDLRAQRTCRPEGLSRLLRRRAPGVAEAAAQRLIARYPGLQVVGTAAPSFVGLSDDEYRKLRARIIEARPHLLIVAASMPHGERWLSAHLEDLGVPVGVNLGASIDFAAGRINRAPRWMQKLGLEWAFRLMLEPGRLSSRYARNARFILGMTLRGSRMTPSKLPVPTSGSPAGTSESQGQSR